MFSWLRLKHVVISSVLLVVLLGVLVSGLVFTQSSKVEAAAPKLTVQITCAKAVANKSASVCAHTLPKAVLTIKVKYCSGKYATSKSLQGKKVADSKGNYTWVWKPETKCRGNATAYVMAALNGKQVSTSKVFKVA